MNETLQNVIRFIEKVQDRKLTDTEVKGVEIIFERYKTSMKLETLYGLPKDKELMITGTHGKSFAVGLIQSHNEIINTCKHLNPIKTKPFSKFRGLDNREYK